VHLNEGTIDAAKCEFFAGTAEELMPTVVMDYSSKGLKIVWIVDPPRSGLHKDVLKALRTCKGLDRIVYVSCNPASQMRDLQALCYETCEKRRAPAFRLKSCIGAVLLLHTNLVKTIVLFKKLHTEINHFNNVVTEAEEATSHRYCLLTHSARGSCTF